MPRLELGLNTFYTESGAQSGGRGVAFANRYSLEFDGTDDYVSSDAVNLGTTSTISMWVKYTGAGALQAHPLGYSGWGGGGYHFYPVGNVLMVIRVEAATLVWNDSTTVTHMANAEDGDWQQWAIVRDGNAVILYINGASMGQKTLSSSQGDTLVDVIGSGWDVGSTYNEWEGNVDEVALWNAILDADAVAAVYNSGTPTDLTSDEGNYDKSGDLVAYWRMEEGTGTSVINTANSGTNDGTLQNGTAWDADVAAAG